MRLTINGEDRTIDTAATVADLLGELGITATKVAVERNLEIVPKTAYGDTALADGDKLEIVHFIGGGSSDADLASANDEGFVVAGHKFKSRLIVGTGKYKDFEETRIAIDASGAEMVTVAVRRVNLTDPSQPMLVDYVEPKKYVYLPNTAGCFTADDSVRTLRLAREAGGWNLVKLEVLGDQKTLYPNMPETLKAAEALIKDGFDVMVYCSDDPIQAKMLEDMGCCAIMPLGSLIEEVIAPHREFGIAITVKREGEATREPVGLRNPGILYGLGNILENAVDFAKSGVEVRSFHDRQSVIITVSDDGPGFSPETLARIGLPFRRSRDRSERQGAGGLGLGLFIAKTLLERSGAELSFENAEGPEHGARVTIAWPRERMDIGPQAGQYRPGLTH